MRNRDGGLGRFGAGAPRRLFRSALLLGGAAMLMAQAPAQAQTPEDDGDIVVTGQRASQRSAVEAQRSSDFVVSVLSADDVGNFPDQNVAEAVRRLPGLSVQNDQGEGRFVTLRGIDTNLNSTSVNGLALPSPQREDSRAVALDTIPSELISRLVVHKTFRPDLPGDAIGGVIEIETTSAFDRSGDWFTARGESSYNDLEGLWSPRFSAAGSTRLSERLGVAGAISYFDRSFGSENNEVDVGWATAGGTTYPIEPEERDYRIDRRRIGAALNLDFLANESTRLFLRTLYADYSDFEIRQRNEFLVRAAAPVASTATTAQFNDRIRIDRDSKDRTQDQFIGAIQAGADVNLNDWSLEFIVGYASAAEDEVDRIDATFRREFRPTLVPGLLVNYDWSDPHNIIVAGANPASASALVDPALYPMTSVTLVDNRIRDDEWTLRFDAQRDLSWGFIKGGVNVRLREREDDLETRVLSGAAIPAGATAALFSQTVDYGLSSFGPAIDAGAVRRFVDERRDSFVRDAFASTSADYASSEDVYAGYLMAQLEHGALTLTGGLRVEHTEFETSGFFFDGVATPLEASSSYTDWLPSLSLRYEPSDNVVLRGAVSRSISRPLPEATAARFAVDDDEASIGNPSLNPLRSWNFDIIGEYYPTSLNVFSAGVFHKVIEDYIVARDIAGEPGFTAYSSAIRSENAGQATISGVEINLQQSFDFLPSPFDGLLVSANYTYVDGEISQDAGGETGVPKLSNNIANLAIGFEKWGWSLRAAVSHRSHYIDVLNSLGFDDRIVRPLTQVDLSAKYDINDRFQIYAEASNVTDEPFVATFTNRNQLSAYETYGPTYAFGVRFTY